MLILFGEQDRRVDQRQMRIGLRKIAQLLFRIEIQILAHQPHVVAVAQHLVEKAARFGFLSRYEQGADEPERADREGRRSL